MFFKKDKPKIEFICHLPGVDKLMPIEKAKPNQFEWYNKCIKHFQQRKEEGEFDNPSERRTSLNRCPGIFTVMGHGWIQRAWQDISITTNGNGSDFSWTTPSDQKRYGNNSPYILEYVGAHWDVQQMYSNDYRNLRSIIKIQSPWSVNIPKGYSLLAMPCPYPDSSRFESAVGILKGGFPQALSVQLRWYVENDTYVIPAGTPLQQYILLKDEAVDTVVRQADPKDRDEMIAAVLSIHNKFVSRYSNIKKVFSK